MRCRRSKKIEGKSEYRRLTSNDEVSAYTEYLIDRRADFQIFYEYDTYCTFATPVTLNLFIDANYIEYMGEPMRSPQILNATNIVKIEFREQNEEYAFYNSNNEVVLFVGQISYMTLRFGATIKFSYIDNSKLAIDAYKIFTKFVTQPSLNGLAFFASYGHSEYIQTAKYTISAGVPTLISYRTQSNIEHRAYLITQIKSNTQLTLSIPNTALGYYTSVGIYKPSTNAYTFIASMVDWASVTSRTFTITNTESDESTVIIFNYNPDEALKNTFDKTMKVEYTKVVHEAIRTDDGETFAKEQENVACSLTQRLSLIKGELWYQVNTGLPLFDKTVTTTTLDAWIVKTIMEHPDVVNIKSFKSNAENHNYHCDVVVITRWGDIEVTI